MGKIWPPCSRRTARRAFTPAAPRRFQNRGNRGVRAAARSGGMRASRPTFARKVAAAPFGRALAAVCGGGPRPSRKTLRRRKAPGPMRASAPTGGCYNAEGAASWSAACPPLAVGADSISARGVFGGLGLPGRYRIGPYRGLLYRGGAASRLAAMFPALRRAGVHARRTTAILKPGRSYRRKVRRDEGIPPYVCPEGRARPVWPGACRGS